jgi:hypothetical protein
MGGNNYKSRAYSFVIPTNRKTSHMATRSCPAVVLLVLLVVGYASAQCPTEGTLAKKLGYSEFYSQTNGILVEPFENSVFSNWDVTTNGDVSHTVTNDANPGVTVTLSGTLAKSQTTSLYFDEEAYWETGIQGENYIYGLDPLDAAVLHIEFSPPVGSFLFAANAMDQASISIFDSNNVIIGCDTIYQVSAPNGVIYYGATTVSEKIKKISIYGVSFAIDDLRFTRCPVGTSEEGYTSGEADCIGKLRRNFRKTFGIIFSYPFVQTITNANWVKMTATNMHFVPMFRILLNVHAKMAGKETELVNLAAAVRTTLFCSYVTY